MSFYVYGGSVFGEWFLRERHCVGIDVRLEGGVDGCLGESILSASWGGCREF